MKGKAQMSDVFLAVTVAEHLAISGQGGPR